MNRGSTFAVAVAVAAACTVSLGSVAVALPSAAAAPAATCTKVPVDGSPNTVRLMGEGFDSVKVSLSSTGGDGYVPDVPLKHGSFTVGPVADHLWWAYPDKGPGVPCVQAAPGQQPPQQSQEEAKDQYSKGFQQGLRETLAMCKQTTPKTLTTDPNWQAGYAKGAETALATKRCQGS
ncbi:hypothetical protein [Streptomyces sp. NPDC090022]|uniref:hypothetical protein n=1 Tax=Streptomyces sp. NPDC090022 TaxID=3365920 RepID=UPI003827B1D5